ncbi:DUF3619 family protein [Variovorax sp. ZT4R33]|uniref:DUF3619 family protein n=1 Tax=Variovorax sp. ZT4R33 TaxID=3443743 RepID=UPI003F463188
MNHSISSSDDAMEAQFGRRVAARLSDGADTMPHDVSERLRVARAQAVALRKQSARPAAVVVGSGSSAVLGGVWWTRFGAVFPLVALVVGLVGISVWQEDQRFRELAEVDSALLTDDLPPAAYTDPGFAQYLKSEDSTKR